MRSMLTSIGLPVAALLAGAPALLAAAPAHRPASVRAPRAIGGVLEVNTGRGRLVTLATPMTDLFVASDQIADVQVRSPTQLYIFGKKTGETTISATDRTGRVIYASTVRVANNMDSVQSMLALAMPEARIVATPMNGLVLLTGTVPAPAEAAEAERLVQAYVGADTKVLSRLRSATPLQVNLQVRIAEVSRSFAKNIGNNVQTFDATSGFKGGIARGRGASTQYTPGGGLFTGGGTPSAGTTGLQQLAGSTTIGLASKALGVNFLDSLDIGESIGQVSTLANPNLSCLSGETCNFLVGGEIPIPLSQGLGAVSVDYKKYGISLSYSATVLSDGRISMHVMPEVSQLSSAGAVTISGTTIPALSTRRAETTIELGSGQSMMIGGLLQNSHDNSIEQTPGLGALPVLGALFRSNGWKRNETELVIVVTPYLVKPVNNQSDIVLPTDGQRSATDLQRVFLGKIDSGVSGARRPVPTLAPSAAAPAAPGPAAPPPLMPAAEVRRSPKQDGRAAAMPGFSN